MHAAAPIRFHVAFVALVALAGCSGPPAEGGMGLPAQREGDAYPGPRAEVTGTVRTAENGCIEVEADGRRWFVIWPAGARLDALVRLPDGTVLDDGDRLTATGGPTPVGRLVADRAGYWANTIGFCAPEATEVLVLDEVRADP
jgi:hypothetical protein